MDLMTYKLPSGEDRIEKIRGAFVEIESYAIRGSKALGRARWLQGKVLLLAREQCTKRGDWSAFLVSVGIKDKLAFLLRKIAIAIPEDRSGEMLFEDMLAEIYDSYKKVATKQGLNADARNEPFVDDDPNAADSSEADADDKLDPSEKPLTINKLRSRLANVAKTMRGLKTSKLVDSKLNPAELPKYYADSIRITEQVGGDAARIKEILTKRSKKVANYSLVKPASGVA